MAALRQATNHNYRLVEFCEDNGMTVDTLACLPSDMAQELATSGNGFTAAQVRASIERAKAQLERHRHPPTAVQQIKAGLRLEYAFDVDGERGWFAGTVTAAAGGKDWFVVAFDDGDVKTVLLQGPGEEVSWRRIAVAGEGEPPPTRAALPQDAPPRRPKRSRHALVEHWTASGAQEGTARQKSAIQDSKGIPQDDKKQGPGPGQERKGEAQGGEEDDDNDVDLEDEEYREPGKVERGNWSDEQVTYGRARPNLISHTQLCCSATEVSALADTGADSPGRKTGIAESPRAVASSSSALRRTVRVC
jgi:hypothetical protein